jgi:myo-inositol-1(or 4)-monophosphatase
MSSYLDIAKSAALEAGALQIQKLGQVQSIEFKGEINLVTEVDRACEEIIQKIIQGAYPDHDFLAEEGGGERKHSDYKWIIDPLDGTTNFAHGYPLFCVSIALEYMGEVIVGLVYDPNRKELFYAQKGQGAFLNDKPISVSKISTLNESLLATGFAYNIRKTKENNLNHFKQMLLNAQAVRRDGVAAIDLCYVACGRYDGFWELNLFPWDVAAGKLIVEEAGGRVTLFSGSSFSVYDKEILCSNGLIHQEMIQQLQKA